MNLNVNSPKNWTERQPYSMTKANDVIKNKTMLPDDTNEIEVNV